MTAYLKWDQQIITDFSEDNVTKMYDKGFVFTRIGKGVMNQTRLIRINLDGFSFNSENRRVLNKTSNFQLHSTSLPIPIEQYDWKIQKLAKDFYKNKLGITTFSANKVKELLTNSTNSNFNSLLSYHLINNTDQNSIYPIGYCVSYYNNSIFHYAYPFYDFVKYPDNTGMGMILKAIEYAIQTNNKYFYIGSVTKPADKYKLQFNNLEWFNGKIWSNDLEALKKIVTS